MDITISPYKTVWAEFVPTSGKVTVHDQKAFGAIHIVKNAKSYRKSFALEQDARTFVRRFNKALDTSYKVFYSTDKQFGLAKEENGYAIPYTQKQLRSFDIIYQNSTVHIFLSTLEQIDTEYMARRLRNASRKERMDAIIGCINATGEVSSNDIPRRIHQAAKDLYYKIF